MNYQNIGLREEYLLTFQEQFYLLPVLSEGEVPATQPVG